jgi:hypothetical protein
MSDPHNYRRADFRADAASWLLDLTDGLGVKQIDLVANRRFHNASSEPGYVRSAAKAGWYSPRRVSSSKHPHRKPPPGGRPYSDRGPRNRRAGEPGDFAARRSCPDLGNADHDLRLGPQGQ